MAAPPKGLKRKRKFGLFSCSPNAPGCIILSLLLSPLFLIISVAIDGSKPPSFYAYLTALLASIGSYFLGLGIGGHFRTEPIKVGRVFCLWQSLIDDLDTLYRVVRKADHWLKPGLVAVHQSCLLLASDFREKIFCLDDYLNQLWSAGLLWDPNSSSTRVRYKDETPKHLAKSIEAREAAIEDGRKRFEDLKKDIEEFRVILQGISSRICHMYSETTQSRVPGPNLALIETYLDEMTNELRMLASKSNEALLEVNNGLL